MTKITRATVVKDAMMSSSAARELFLAHGVNPEWCGGMGEFHTLDDLERWCGATDVDGLIARLNAETTEP